MRGLVASVTSCIGGKDERYAIRVSPAAPQPFYFVFKSLRDFEALWAQLEALALQVRDDPAPTLACQWLARFVERYAFQTIVLQLRQRGVETLTTLNLFLSALVRHVAALYVENTILRCGCSRLDRQLALVVRQFLEFRKEDSTLRKRQWVEIEIRPEESPERSPRKRSLPTFPGKATATPSAHKSRRLSTVNEEDFRVPPIRKVELAVPLPARRRGFAEVDISI